MIAKEFALDGANTDQNPPNHLCKAGSGAKAEVTAFWRSVVPHFGRRARLQVFLLSDHRLQLGKGWFHALHRSWQVLRCCWFFFAVPFCFFSRGLKTQKKNKMFATKGCEGSELK